VLESLKEGGGPVVSVGKRRKKRCVFPLQRAQHAEQEE